jgi:preprotein translocase subunit SecF
MKQYFSIISKAFLRLGVACVLGAGALWMFFTHMSYSIQFTGGMEVVVEKDIQ